MAIRTRSDTARGAVLVQTALRHAFVACALLCVAGPVPLAAQNESNTTIEFEGDAVDRASVSDLSRRIAIAENKIDVYVDLSRTGAKEGLESALDDFKRWFPAYNEQHDVPAVALMKALLAEFGGVVMAPIPAGSEFGKLAFGFIVGQLQKAIGRSGTTYRLGNTEAFLETLEREYGKWVLDEGLSFFDRFKKDKLYAAAVDRYVEDFEDITLESDGVEDDGRLRRLMSQLGVPPPGRETRRQFHECGLFMLVKRAVVLGGQPATGTGESEWEFLDMDLDTYVRVEQIGRRYIDWKSPFDICRK